MFYQSVSSNLLYVRICHP